jgi:uncharacterized protein (DUF1330 family)
MVPLVPGYWIVRGTVKDREAFDVYAQHWLPIAEAHGARYLTAGGRHETREGVDFDRVVIVEFPSYDAARACYDSSEYQTLLGDVLKAYDRELTIVDVDGKFETPS